MTTDRQTDRQTDRCTNLVTLSLLELLIAAEKHPWNTFLKTRNILRSPLQHPWVTLGKLLRHHWNIWPQMLWILQTKQIDYTHTEIVTSSLLELLIVAKKTPLNIVETILKHSVDTIWCFMKCLMHYRLQRHNWKKKVTWTDKRTKS